MKSDRPGRSGDDKSNRQLESDFYESLFEGANEMIVAYDASGVIARVSPSVRQLLGLTPDQIIGDNIADYIRPEDLERSMRIAIQAQRESASLGSGLISLRHADGTWVPTDVILGEARLEGQPLTVAFCRFALYQQSESQTLLRLLNAAPLVDVMEPLLNTINWQPIDSHMAICWHDDEQRHHVSTGLPGILCGTDDIGPWQQVRTSGLGVWAEDSADFGDELRSIAQAHDRGAYWIEPVRVDGYAEPALITIWTADRDIDPKIHEQGMSLARQYVHIVLRFTAQRREVDHAASHDLLTGLANRNVLVEMLQAEVSGGALLYCDLDGFKPVNDRHGHAVGDRLLRLVAERLGSCVRPVDVIARMGGDEFVVLLPNVGRQLAEELASRILESFRRPFALEGLTIEIGVSIGLAQSTTLNASVLDDADQAMYAAKAAGRGVIRWSS